MNRPARLACLVVTLLAVLIAPVGCRREQPPAEDDAPAPVWPLTGEDAPDEDAIRERVVSVKIENLPAARPQTGLSSADVVYETLTEGGITRFNALFHSDLPEQVGPVRSARFSDTHIVPQYGALFCYSGANQQVLAAIEEAGIQDMGANRAAELYSRTDRPAPHNLYLDLPGVREGAAAEGFEETADPPELSFGDAPSTESTATAVTVPFRAQNRVTWTWDAEERAYTRDINGEEHVDTESGGRPYAAANVVVIFAEESGGDRPGTLEIQLTGSGDAIVLRDGLLFEGAKWSASEGAPPTFETAGGQELRLAPGKTWIEVVPQGLAVETE